MKSNYRAWIVIFGVFGSYESHGVGCKAIGALQVHVIIELTINPKRAWPLKQVQGDVAQDR